jgi:hypothetical protein
MDEENNSRDNEPKPINVDELIDKESKHTREKFNKTPKHYLDVNMSWPMLILVGLGIFGIAYAFEKEVNLSAGYVILALCCSLLAAVIIYNLGKILFGYIAGYRVWRMEFLGLQLVSTDDGKSKVSYHFSEFLEFHMNLKPRNSDLPTKSALMYLGGTIVYAIAAGLAIGLSFLGDKTTASSMPLILRYGAALGAMVVFYEMFPCRLDVYNDMYLLIILSDKEEKEAYNHYLEDLYTDYIGEFNNPVTYPSYENSRTKPLTLLAVLHNQVYANEYDNALKTIQEIENNELHINDTIRVETLHEELYLFLTHGRTTESEKLVTVLDKAVKNSSDYHSSISALRSDILIAGLLDNSIEELNTSIDEFKKGLKYFGQTPRTEKDLALANACLVRVGQAHPDWKLTPLSFEDAKESKKTEKSDKGTETKDDYDKSEY